MGKFTGLKRKTDRANKALHLTAIPLRSTAAGELGRYMGEIDNGRIE